jgi:hypothetical protein
VLRLTDLSRCDDTLGELRALQDREEREPLSLTDGPMMRLHLVRLAPDRTVGLIVVNHIVWDGDSFDVFARQWRARFMARLAGGEPPGPPRRQFRDVAAWHLAWLRTADAEADLDWWVRTLDGLAGTCDLAERARSFRGWRRFARIDAATTGALRDLCLPASATLFMGLHAVATSFRFASTGERDVLVSSPISLRGRPVLDEQLGPLVNTVTLRHHVDPAASFLDLLRAVRASAMRSYDRRLTPPRDIARRLGLAPDRPLSAVGLTLQAQDRAPWIAELARPGATMFGAHAALWFDVREDRDALSVELTARQGSFEEDDVDDLVASFAHVFEHVVAHPLLPLGTLTAALSRTAAPLSIDLDV